MELDDAQRRRAKNEALFRRINERLESLNEAFGTVSNTFSVVCECDDAACAAEIRLTNEQYEQIRADPTKYIVLAGHETDGVERVVGGTDEWHVVKKQPGEPAAIAEATDPRSR